MPPQAGVVPNLGWPCYEGTGRLAAFDTLDLNICERLYADSGAVTPPLLSYKHGTALVAGDGCTLTAGDSVTGGVFIGGGGFPARYQGAYVFGDYALSL